MKPLIHYTHDYLLNPVHPVTIAVAGAGGTGSQVMTHLARINYSLRALGHPGIFVELSDPDIVTDANPGRQMFSESEIGTNKAEAITARINRVFGFDWIHHPTRLEKTPKANIVLTCVDNAQSRINADKSLSRSKRGYRDTTFYWMDFGNTKTRGQVILGTCYEGEAKKSNNYEVQTYLKNVVEMYPNLKEHESKTEQGPSCSLAQALQRQDLFVNTAVAFAGCAILWKLFTQYMISSHGVFVNLDTMVHTPVKIQKYIKPSKVKKKTTLKTND